MRPVRTSLLALVLVALSTSGAHAAGPVGLIREVSNDAAATVSKTCNTTQAALPPTSTDACREALSTIEQLVVTDVVRPVEPDPDRYVVVLNDPSIDSSGVSGGIDGAISPDAAAAQAEMAGADVTHVYRHVLRGYAARMGPQAYARVAADPSVKYIVQDAVGEIDTTQYNAPWGLDRIDQRPLPLNTEYTYQATGAGVRAYVVDTGIRASHAEFGGRVLPGVDFVDNALPADDCGAAGYGHGTHVAGIIGGATYGVAKQVTLVPVRVGTCAGTTDASWVVAALDWIVQTNPAGQAAVVNTSLGFTPPNQAVDDAANGLIAAGLPLVASAGNKTENACNRSPARVPDAMTTGSSTSSDAKATTSNYGDCVDWFAPGDSIVSTWNRSDSSTTTMGGTSMAAPHTAGVVAQFLQGYPEARPGTIRNNLFNLTTKNIVTSALTTNNHLLHTPFKFHVAAGGVITIKDDGGGPSFTTTGVYATHFSCSIPSTGPLRVECDALPNPTVQWVCTAFVLTAQAPSPTAPGGATGNVNGKVQCDNANVLSTQDVSGTGISVVNNQNPPLDLGTANRVTCRPAGIGGGTNATGSYQVTCNEPGYTRPLQ